MVQAQYHSLPAGCIAVRVSRPLTYWNFKECSETFKHIITATPTNRLYLIFESFILFIFYMFYIFYFFNIF